MSSLNERLIQYLWKHQHASFVYGHHDCGTFTCGWVDSELRTDYVLQLRNKCRSGGLVKFLQRITQTRGYSSIVSEFCGFDGTPGPGKLGDIGVFEQPDGRFTLGVQSVRLIHIPGSEGVVAFDSVRIVEHWSLECLKQPQPQ